MTHPEPRYRNLLDEDLPFPLLPVACREGRDQNTTRDEDDGHRGRGTFTAVPDDVLRYLPFSGHGDTMADGDNYCLISVLPTGPQTRPGGT